MSDRGSCPLVDPDVWRLFMVMTADEAADRIASPTNNRTEVT